MQFENYSIFPTLVSRVQNALTEQECQTIINNVNKKSLWKYDAWKGNSLTSFLKQNQWLDNELMKPIEDKINLHLATYAIAYGCSDIYMTNSHIVIQYEDSELTKHSHPGSVVSGVVYLKADEQSSSIYFYNPNPFASFTSRLDDDSEYLRETVKLSPKTGDMILFPSWLLHGSNGEKNKSKERISFSFNSNYF